MNCFLAPNLCQTLDPKLNQNLAPKVQLAVKKRGCFLMHKRGMIFVTNFLRKIDTKIQLKIVPLKMFVLSRILFPRSRDFPFYGSRFWLTLDG